MRNEPQRKRAVAGEEDAGERLDLWLAKTDGELSRSRIQKLIAAGAVRVRGELKPARHRLAAGDLVEWEIPPTQPSTMAAEAEVVFRIVHEDQDLAVIDKPAGLVVHPAPGHAEGTLVHGLLAQLDGLSGVGGVERPGIVHRLDKDTSGLMVVAKNDRCHRQLQAQLSDHSLHRVYRAICWGVPEPAEGEIELPVGRHPRDRKRQAVVPGGRAAHTKYWVEEDLAGAALVRLRLFTGRTHQIRVHLAHGGHPLLADELYGGGTRRLKGAQPSRRSALSAALAALGRQALHAAELAFVHPGSGEEVRFLSPLPQDFEAALKCLR
ncbi:MAG TPA: RluA family pseudouridine synthase [Candidatus Krumholzibacteria bacterium]|nr:RluA family pseudouridine synthase [Candidatus Krumholzibacteria bacterium]